MTAIMHFHDSIFNIQGLVLSRENETICIARQTGAIKLQTLYAQGHNRVDYIIIVLL